MAGGRAPQMQAVITLRQAVRGAANGALGLKFDWGLVFKVIRFHLIPDFCCSFEHAVVLEGRQARQSEHDEGGEQERGNGH